MAYIYNKVYNEEEMDEYQIETLPKLRLSICK